MRDPQQRKALNFMAIGKIGHHRKGWQRFGQILRKSQSKEMLPRASQSGEKFQISWLLGRLVIIVEDGPDLD